jgi:molybdopterin synthase catalytic subunit
MVVITAAAIDPAKVYGMLDTGAAGSIVQHYAVVKPLTGRGGTTSYIDFTATVGTEAEIADIAAALGKEFALTDVLLIRRLGRVAVGEIISLVAVSAESSDQAFAACTAGIARLRAMKEIIKEEVRG